jgi:ferredoxin-NADP reductase
MPNHIFPEDLIEEYAPALSVALIKREHEFEDIYTFTFAKPDDFDFYAGQNVRLELRGYEGQLEGQRSMSMASAPFDEYLKFSMRIGSGSVFKQSIMRLQPGDEVNIIKRKGWTVWPNTPPRSAVLIAGGLGITPFASMMRVAERQGFADRVVLVHVNRNCHLYEDELSKIDCRQIRIGRNELPETLNVITGVPHDLYYVIGSPSFKDALTNSLQEKGVPEDRIITSRFSGYSELLD